MEVHHHSHSGHGKKTWRNYGWEFIMLFLAVFCGFLAEWRLEQVIEHHREKEFIQSMVKDLETDSTNVNLALADTMRVKGMDSLVMMMQVSSFQQLDQKKIFVLTRRYVNFFNPMMFTRSTLLQLKNSGSLRLIRNKQVVDTLNKIDAMMTACDGQLEAYKNALHNTMNFEIKVFNLAAAKNDSIWPFITTDYYLTLQLSNAMFIQKSIYKGYHRMLLEYRESCRQAIPFIKKEYNLEEE